MKRYAYIGLIVWVGSVLMTFSPSLLEARRETFWAAPMAPFYVVALLISVVLLSVSSSIPSADPGVGFSPLRFIQFVVVSALLGFMVPLLSFLGTLLLDSAGLHPPLGFIMWTFTVAGRVSMATVGCPLATLLVFRATRSRPPGATGIDEQTRKTGRVIRVLLAVAGIAFVGSTGLLWFGMWRASQPRVALGSVARSEIRKKCIPIPDNARDEFYWYKQGIDHTAYLSFTLPAHEAEAWLSDEVRNNGLSATLVPGNKSEFQWINEGPSRSKPKKWKPEYWNLTSITNGLMYERRHWFGCVDPDTGRIYISTWSE